MTALSRSLTQQSKPRHLVRACWFGQIHVISVHSNHSKHSNPRQSNEWTACIYKWFFFPSMCTFSFFLNINWMGEYIILFKLVKCVTTYPSAYIKATVCRSIDFCSILCVQPRDCYHTALILDILHKNVNETHCQSCLCCLTWWSCIMLELYILFTKRAWEMTSPENTGGPRAGVRPLLGNTWLLLLTGHHRTRSVWLTCQEMSNHSCPFCPLIAWNVYVETNEKKFSEHFVFFDTCWCINSNL